MRAGGQFDREAAACFKNNKKAGKNKGKAWVKSAGTQKIPGPANGGGNASSSSRPRRGAARPGAGPSGVLRSCYRRGRTTPPASPACARARSRATAASRNCPRAGPARASQFWGGGTSLKIIAVLREPVGRFQSQFQMRVRLQASAAYLSRAADDEANDDLDAFAKAVVSHPKWWKKDPVPALFPPARNGVYEGVYVAHLNRWLKHFAAPDHLRVYFYESFYFSDTPAKLGDPSASSASTRAVDTATIVNRSYNTHGDGHSLTYEAHQYLSAAAKLRLWCLCPQQRLSVPLDLPPPLEPSRSSASSRPRTRRPRQPTRPCRRGTASFVS